MDMHIREGDASSIGPQSVKEVVRDLFRKAQEFISALELETGLRVEPNDMRNLQTALLEDFIEVHNAAIANALRLPKARTEVDVLLVH